jgi:DNA (cytosine-5)-methyltransferase 1
MNSEKRNKNTRATAYFILISLGESAFRSKLIDGRQDDLVMEAQIRGKPLWPGAKIVKNTTIDRLRYCLSFGLICMKKRTAIDLFAGCGGLTLGLKLAGFKVLAAVEIDKLAADTYKVNHPGVRILQDDIRAVSAKSLRERLKLEPGELDLLAGCPPCQGFSSLRTRNGARQRRDRRNRLIREMIRFTRAFLPKAVMMENVPGLAEHWSFRKLCRDLRNLGYRVEWEVKDARHYGVPQRRKRLILVAGRRFNIQLAQESQSLKTVRSAFANLRRPGESRDALQNLGEQRSAKVLKLIKSIPKNGGSRGDLPRSRQLKCHKRTDGFRDIYGRMAWDAPYRTSEKDAQNREQAV